MVSAYDETGGGIFTYFVLVRPVLLMSHHRGPCDPTDKKVRYDDRTLFEVVVVRPHFLDRWTSGRKRGRAPGKGAGRTVERGRRCPPEGVVGVTWT